MHFEWRVPQTTDRTGLAKKKDIRVDKSDFPSFKKQNSHANRERSRAKFLRGYKMGCRSGRSPTEQAHKFAAQDGTCTRKQSREDQSVETGENPSVRVFVATVSPANSVPGDTPILDHFLIGILVRTYRFDTSATTAGHVQSASSLQLSPPPRRMSEAHDAQSPQIIHKTD
ncbi:hypothetical protein SISSUDRAFT_1030464 [Sistotremastrum suecicum HHB10207 ss-3]|uniref:Uncharacterized protein n=1 Tax=Sistotremastrum suecicum HHB10207 ss-3 TaxID=1314776 RepID=A0A166H7Y0_9AGAM|nr:hypothetical protein SISSUDRAFT_1030464 [Sistotremastrum suecicum HHB10207 ss-3]